MSNYLITLQLTFVFSKKQFIADVRSENFGLALTYTPNERTHAEICRMKRSESLTGTETMLLIEHILLLMDCHSVGFFNVAYIGYTYLPEYRKDRHRVSLMELRCMRGDSTGYSNFGYFNQLSSLRRSVETRIGKMAKSVERDGHARG